MVAVLSDVIYGIKLDGTDIEKMGGCTSRNVLEKSFNDFLALFLC